MRTATDSIEQDRFTTSWSVQYLITALSYHISRNEVPRLWKSSDKDHLMRQCRDTAFVQLLGLAPETLEPDTEGDSLCYQTDEDGERIKILEQRLLNSLDQGANEGLFIAECMSSERRVRKRGVTCPLFLPDILLQDRYEPRATITDGDAILRFLRALQGSVRLSQADRGSNKNQVARVVSSTMDGQNDSAAAIEVTRKKNASLVNAPPDPDCLFAGEYTWPFDSLFSPRSDEKHGDRGSGEYVGGNNSYGPCPSGWFLESKSHPVHFAEKGKTSVAEKDEPFKFDPSKSPVQVSLGTLFTTYKPGEMTFFETSDLKYAEKSRSSEPPLYEVCSEEQQQRIRQQERELKIGEEAELARDALLALYGVRSSLFKLRGKLMVPEALSRPATASILLAVERASTCRQELEEFVTRGFSHASEHDDPILYALVSCVRDTLFSFDGELMEIELGKSDSWIQQVGIAAGTVEEHVQNLLTAPSRSRSETIAEDGPKGALIHGIGVSLLQLAQNTAGIQSKMKFLSNFLQTSDLDNKPSVPFNFPTGIRILEYIYEKGLPIEGDHGILVRNLMQSSLFPFLSVVNGWAFGTQSFDSNPYLSGALSRYYVIEGNRQWQEQSRSIKSSSQITTGIAELPNFISQDVKSSILIAGTQIRLLKSLEDKMKNVSNLMAILSWNPVDAVNRMDDSNRGWFEFQDCLKEGKKRGYGPDELAGKLNSVLRYICESSRIRRELVDGWVSCLSDGMASPDDRLSRPIHQSPGINEISGIDKEALNILSLPSLLDIMFGEKLIKHSLAVSRACISLFDHLQIFAVFQFMRDIFMGHNGDFQFELAKRLDQFIIRLEPLTSLNVDRALKDANMICSISDKLLDSVLIKLLPGENAIDLAVDGLDKAEATSGGSRIRQPYYSAMAPMVVPPSGYNALDCIFLSIDVSWPSCAVVTTDTLTAYAAIFNVGLRTRRVQFALEATLSFLSKRKFNLRVSCFSTGSVFAKRISQLRMFCSSAAFHMRGYSDFHRDCCFGSEWVILASKMRSTAQNKSESIHEMIELHRNYIYKAAGRMLSCCGSISIKIAFERMMAVIHDIRNCLDSQLRRNNTLENILLDHEVWKHLEMLMAQYDDCVNSLKAIKNGNTIPASEDEGVVARFLDSIL